jgi:polynucleotide 5'-kinase involved in rRNA processing
MQRTIRSTFLSFYHRIFASPLSLHPNNPFYQSKWVRTRFVHSPASAPSNLQSLTSLQLHVNVVVIGHVDSGKSTTTGHLIYSASSRGPF